ncbi:Gfo/Idh/MocA family oxidoreductase [Aeromonas rivipollensis]|uniref:Gfo/Idh/MocA family oxidoreductase n=1 Tax=Aeromonas rivipollensis TaxID=948519 RepID=A0ABX0D0P1_9GAMM|nr:Gfo/Idh/MocA family oxidoreductase [Aeromonas rivipollensis]NEX89806.1 Gfo/Idh/MocA family oxidoreductase [Aeromonas rivipollensis]NEY06694.1 Gfo/Idh/MocA family oxidoreductase [Aeromonas rivipollensis]
MKRRLRLGMVGGGQGAFIGAVHRLAARMDDHYELLAAALSADPANARSSALALGLDPARAYEDYARMAQAEAARSDGIEVVAITTPNHLHAPVARAFLEAGIHVICDKPLALTLAEGEELARLARQRRRLFALTHTYSGYPMVRHARELVSAGELGELRYVQVEYLQDWLANPIPLGQNKQADWRADPARAGRAGCLGDIGTHAYQLAAFITGLLPSELAAELHSFVPGRQLDDHLQVWLRYPQGMRGSLNASQVASGEENRLQIRLYGDKASLIFRQEAPNELWLTPIGGASQRLTRGRVASDAARHASRVPAGHPEGYLEAFAQLYTDAALQIHALAAGEAPPPESLALTTVEDGVAGMRFIETSLASHAADGRWLPLS